MTGPRTVHCALQTAYATPHTASFSHHLSLALAPVSFPGLVVSRQFSCMLTFFLHLFFSFSSFFFSFFLVLCRSSLPLLASPPLLSTACLLLLTPRPLINLSPFSAYPPTRLVPGTLVCDQRRASFTLSAVCLCRHLLPSRLPTNRPTS